MRCARRRPLPPVAARCRQPPPTAARCRHKRKTAFFQSSSTQHPIKFQTSESRDFRGPAVFRRHLRRCRSNPSSSPHQHHGFICSATCRSVWPCAVSNAAAGNSPHSAPNVGGARLVRPPRLAFLPSTFVAAAAAIAAHCSTMGASSSFGTRHTRRPCRPAASRERERGRGTSIGRSVFLARI